VLGVVVLSTEAAQKPKNPSSPAAKPMVSRLAAGGKWIRNLALTIKSQKTRNSAIFLLDYLDKIVDKTPISTGVVDGKTTTQFSPATDQWGPPGTGVSSGRGAGQDREEGSL
jgi:hypothetical protein